MEAGTQVNAEPMSRLLNHLSDGGRGQLLEWRLREAASASYLRLTER